MRQRRHRSFHMEPVGPSIYLHPTERLGYGCQSSNIQSGKASSDVLFQALTGLPDDPPQYDACQCLAVGKEQLAPLGTSLTLTLLAPCANLQQWSTP